ncbi:2-hydroxyacid dehydrogenase [Aquabacter cavernae]|uniref:2-hydroxyacid dehydrogenase n=1 Tax=Aquabacter cavernae TaxID=2496029 RepID=UPI000F8D6CE8|nr:2-hydroxyacid dehydrogenase [Aquabacter cavernae]
MSPVREPLLVLIPFAPDHLARLNAAHDVIYAPDPRSRADAIAGAAKDVRAVLTHGTAGLSAGEMDALPRLQIVSCYGVGYDRIEVPAALERNIMVTHGPGTNTGSVADHAFALILSTVRCVPESDRAVRAGQWHEARRSAPELSTLRLGILGLGAIGRAVARRGALGFEMSVGYHNRNPAADAPYAYHAGVLDLADASDVLVVAAPGGAATRHLIDAQVLEALGPRGYLINIARGSLVDTDALIAALHAGQIAGAGLDVVDGEPVVPPALLNAPNLVITPHSAARSPTAEDNMTVLALKNLAAHFAGAPVLTPVPEWARRLG